MDVVISTNQSSSFWVHTGCAWLTAPAPFCVSQANCTTSRVLSPFFLTVGLRLPGSRLCLIEHVNSKPFPVGHTLYITWRFISPQRDSESAKKDVSIFSSSPVVKQNMLRRRASPRRHDNAVFILYLFCKWQSRMYHPFKFGWNCTSKVSRWNESPQFGRQCDFLSKLPALPLNETTEVWEIQYRA